MSYFVPSEWSLPRTPSPRRPLGAQATGPSAWASVRECHPRDTRSGQLVVSSCEAFGRRSRLPDRRGCMCWLFRPRVRAHRYRRRKKPPLSDSARCHAARPSARSDGGCAQAGRQGLPAARYSRTHTRALAARVLRAPGTEVAVVQGRCGGRLDPRLSGPHRDYRGLRSLFVVNRGSVAARPLDVRAGEPKALIGAYIPARVRRQVRHLGGRQVTVYELPEGQSFYSGHVVIEWRQRKLAFQVSMHGYENVSRVELMSRALMGEVARCPSSGGMSPDDPCRLVF